MKKILIASLLLSCAPTYRIVQEVKHVPKPQTCPTLSMLLGDFALTSVALALSALRFSSRDYGMSGMWAGIGMGIAVGDNLAETTCR
jgi:hypothetical protein